MSTPTRLTATNADSADSGTALRLFVESRDVGGSVS